MKNAVSPEKLARQQEKEAKELARLKRAQAKPKGPGYLLYFILIITVIYIADEVTTVIGTQMQSIVANQIFAPVFGVEYAVARMSTLGVAATAFSMLAFLYKPLSDRFGRKLFLVINTIGMGLGMALVGVASGVPVYLIGACVIAFFIPHDMQAVYIYESTPSEHRAKIYSIVKALATLGIFLVAILRNVFIPSTDLTGWRMVYLVPAAVALIIAVFALFFVRESDAFLESRIRQLEMTEEERLLAKERKQEGSQKSGILGGFRFLFGHKQLRWLSIAHGFVFCGMVLTMYYETTMTFGFARHFQGLGMELEAAKLEATGYVTTALLLFPIGSAAFQMIQGFFSDGLGRKKAAIIMSGVSLASFVIFFVGANRFWNPYLVGFLAGAAVGSYWAAGDIILLMVTESTPTSLRSSVSAVEPIISSIIYTVFFIVFMVLMNLLGDAKIGLLCLIFAAFGMGVGLLILIFKTRETKGVDLGAIRGDEFEA